MAVSLCNVAVLTPSQVLACLVFRCVVVSCNGGGVLVSPVSNLLTSVKGSRRRLSTFVLRNGMFYVSVGSVAVFSVVCAVLSMLRASFSQALACIVGVLCPLVCAWGGPCA